MSAPPSLISALITLLRDPEIKVHGPARHKLLELRDRALPALQAAYRNERDPATRERIHGVLHCLHALEMDDELEAFALQDDADLELERGCILLAQVAYPDEAPDAITTGLDALAAAVAPRLAGVTEPLEHIEILSRFLFVECGFHGHQVGCDDPDHSFLNRVLERRKGLPISLSAVTILVARRIGLQICGVGMPGHYIVKYRIGSGDDILFDPWGGGAIISRHHCAELVGSWGVVLEDHHLDVISDRATLQRMCRNLIKPFWRRNDHQRLGHVVRFLHMLEDDGDGAAGG